MPTLESTAEVPVTSAPVAEPNGSAPKAAKAKKTTAKAKKTTAKAKKTTAKAKVNKVAKEDRGITKVQVKILKILAKNVDGLTRQEISEKLGTKDKPVELKDRLGHTTPEKVTASSLLGRKFASIHAGEPRKLKDKTFSDTEGPKIYKITAAGKKTIEAAA